MSEIDFLILNIQFLMLGIAFLVLEIRIVFSIIANHHFNIRTYILTTRN